MGLLNSALQIGRSAILSYQGALHTVGNNISNAGSPDHTRLTPDLQPIQGSLINGQLQPGAGVAFTDIQRNIDEALEGRMRHAIGAAESSVAQRDALAQIEVAFDDASGADVGTRMSDFFHLFDELQNTPDDPAVRDLVVSGGSNLANSLRGLRQQLGTLGGAIDDQIAQVVTFANDAAKEIARLNGQITSDEAGRRGEATALRDRRDALLRKLSEFFDVTVRQQPNGGINVYVGSEALIQGGTSRGLTTTTASDGEFRRTTVRFADTNQAIVVRGGRIGGLIKARDEQAYGRIQRVDDLAAGIISEVNRIHADGQGLDGLRQVTGAQDLLAGDVSLDSPTAGLVEQPKSGSFYITVLDDATHTPVAHRIDVTLDGSTTATTLDSLVQNINDNVPGVTASVTPDKRLFIKADAGSSFTFGYDGQDVRPDTSGVLAALGVNTFFAGRDARDIEVNAALKVSPALIAAGSVFLSGDGTNAGRLAELATTKLDALEGLSTSGFYGSISNAVAVAAGDANTEVDATQAVHSSLQAQRESISGVNLDEEAIALLKYERSFQGAARFVTVVDQLLGEVVALIR